MGNDFVNNLLGVVGRSTEPELPAVDAISDHDLERMLARAFRMGDSGRADRVKEIKRLRQQHGSPITGELLTPALAAADGARAATAGNGSSLGQFANNAVAAYDQLNGALSIHPLVAVMFGSAQSRELQRPVSL